jgi:hypothetical protein
MEGRYFKSTLPGRSLRERGMQKTKSANNAILEVEDFGLEVC